MEVKVVKVCFILIVVFVFCWLLIIYMIFVMVVGRFEIVFVIL